MRLRERMPGVCGPGWQHRAAGQEGGTRHSRLAPSRQDPYRGARRGGGRTKRVTLLSDRLRGMLKPPSAGAAPWSGRLCVEHSQPVSAADSLEHVLGGEWREDSGARCFVVERRVGPDARCGRVRVGDLAAWHERAAAHAPMLTAGAPARPPFVFFDLETTGLSGGAGTYACLVGCGRFADDGAFLTKQYVLAAFGDERAMLEMVARDLARAEALVSFNGRSFDAPLLETRYLYHRLAWQGASLPHIDMLHIARRFWKRQ